MKKIAIIGNMNNNGFSIMRYFRLLGADAHLFQYNDDGCGTLKHFSPESDTWEISKWNPYIHRIDISNSPAAILNEKLNLVLDIHNKRHPTFRFRHVLRNFEVFVGSGIAPAVFYKYRKKLDIFYPYSTGVEFIEGGSIYGLSPPWWRRSISWVASRYQQAGIQRSKNILNGEMGRTQAVLDSMGVKTHNLCIPMVFNLEKVETITNCTGKIAEVFQRIEKSDFSILSHTSHRWANPSADPLRPSKNNDWLIKGFSEFCRSRPCIRPLLILLDYGPDVDASKKLISYERIENFVIWLPTMNRRELSLILSKVSIAAGEFITTPRTIWGGTGWETIAAGKPLLNGFFFNEGEFNGIFGHQPPPILEVRTPEDVMPHISRMHDNPDVCSDIGNESKKWFDNFNGIGLARRWLEILGCEPGHSLG